MRTKRLSVIVVLLSAVLASALFFAGCGKKDELPRNNEKELSGLVSPLPSPEVKGAHYDENMELFGDFLNHIYTYECVYYYYKTQNRDQAYQNALALKTKVWYAINQDYFLTEEEQKEIGENADKYLQMEFYGHNLSGGYTPESAAQALFGISWEQYQKLRLCETLAEKCQTALFEELKTQGDASQIKAYYETRKDAYDFVVLRYISYTIRPGGNSATNQGKVEAARALCDRLNSLEDMMAIIGGESDRQSEGNSNGQETVYLNDTDHLFYEFIKERGTTVGAKTMIYGVNNAYVLMCEGYYTFDNSEAVVESVKQDYAADAAEQEMMKNPIQYQEPEDWYKMSGMEELQAAKYQDDYTSMIPKLKIAEKAETIFLTIQDPGDTTACKFYAYEKTDGVWHHVFKTAGYVGRSGVADTKDRVEGNGTSPAGVYPFGMLFGIEDNPGELQKAYKKLDEDDYWDGDKYSDTYNQYVKGSEMPASWNADASEHLIDYRYAYNYAAMINYNVDPIIKGKGSAIFLHCTSPGTLASAGCISIPENKMIRALRMIDDQAYIVIVRNAEDLLSYCTQK